ncbi:type IV pilus assembly protein PilM [Candidatus Gottesmanbacteria bacterium]|nr:type IV pilus assembly protein PilM [Candidatus Gottesmanbacteria bacterium]
MDTIVGLDIGSHSVKLIELARDSKGVTLLAAGSAPTPPKALASTVQSDWEAVAVIVKKLFKDTATKAESINIALPESQVFTRIIEVPALSSRELTSAIKWEAEQYIPLPLDDVTVDFTVLRDAAATGTNKMDVLLVASPKTLVEKYVTILEMSDLSVNAVETEILATTRALVKTIPNVKTVMIASLGAQTTDFAIVRDGVLAFTRSIAAGGEALSRSLSQKLGFEMIQAEAFKRTYGLEKDKLEGKIVEAIKPIMDTIIGEMNRAIAFYQEKFKGEKIGVVLLSGGTARLPGLVVYLAQTLGLEVQLANPWVGIARDARFKVLDGEGSVFTVAVGLALR